MVENFYKKKIDTLLAESGALKQKSRTYLFGKLFFFFTALVLAYYAYDRTEVWLGVCSVACWVVYFVIYAWDVKCMSSIKRLRAELRVCENEMSCMQGDYTPFEDGKAFADPEHEYAFDLDLFGPSSLYQRVNRTVTEIGSVRLAEKLKNLEDDREKILELQQAIKNLSEWSDQRIAFMAAEPVKGQLDGLSKVVAAEKYSSFLLHSKVPFLTVPLTLLMAVLAVAGVFPWAGFLFMFALQIGITVFVGRASAKTAQQTDGLYKEFKGYLRILEIIADADFKSAKLSALKHELLGGEVNSKSAFVQLSTLLNLFSQRSNELVGAILNGVFLYDLFLVRKFVKWRELHLSHVSHWLDCIAEFDALVSWGNYAFNHPHNKVAEVLPADSDFVVQAEGVYHPFLHEDKAISNDFELLKRNVSIVTGANMAGKSTFLRTIGVAYIMACNGVPVCARTFRFSIVSLFSSMRTADDLSKDISYFNAELLRLKQLLHHIKSHPFTLIILDEILKGTNSRDKLKGSIMFLEEISKYNVAAIIATHDLELSKMENQFPDVYKNYCFEIDLSEEIQYTYKIARGVAKNLNASFLLENILKEG